MSDASSPGLKRVSFRPSLEAGAHDRASPNFFGLTSLENEYFCYLLYSVFLFNAILGLDFLGLALSRPLLEATEPH
jgi:hypothetical protein